MFLGCTIFSVGTALTYFTIEQVSKYIQHFFIYSLWEQEKPILLYREMVSKRGNRPDLLQYSRLIG
jgi:hypothetical protein